MSPVRRDLRKRPHDPTIPGEGKRWETAPDPQGSGASSRPGSVVHRSRRQLRVTLSPVVHPTADATRIPAVDPGDLRTATPAPGRRDLLVGQERGSLRRRSSRLDRGALGTAHHPADPTGTAWDGVGAGAVPDTGPHCGHSHEPSGPCWAAPPHRLQFTSASTRRRPASRMAGRAGRAEGAGGAVFGRGRGAGGVGGVARARQAPGPGHACT